MGGIAGKEREESPECPFFPLLFSLSLVSWETGNPPGAHTCRLKWEGDTLLSANHHYQTCGGRGCSPEARRAHFWKRQRCRPAGPFISHNSTERKVQTVVSQPQPSLCPASPRGLYALEGKGLDQKCWEKEVYSPKLEDAYWLLISTKLLGFPKWGLETVKGQSFS